MSRYCEKCGRPMKADKEWVTIRYSPETGNPALLMRRWTCQNIWARHITIEYEDELEIHRESAMSQPMSD